VIRNRNIRNYHLWNEKNGEPLKASVLKSKDRRKKNMSKTTIHSCKENIWLKKEIGDFNDEKYHLQ
jgi:hypothetical protein